MWVDVGIVNPITGQRVDVKALVDTGAKIHSSPPVGSREVRLHDSW